MFNRIATADAAAAAQANPPFLRLLAALPSVVQNPQPGKSIVYWMRMGDLRSKLVHRSMQRGHRPNTFDSRRQQSTCSCV